MSAISGLAVLGRPRHRNYRGRPQSGVLQVVLFGDVIAYEALAFESGPTRIILVALLARASSSTSCTPWQRRPAGGLKIGKICNHITRELGSTSMRRCSVL